MIASLLMAAAVASFPSDRELDELMGRYYAGAADALQGNAACLAADQQAWLRRRDACKEARCLESAYRERLAELQALQPGMNLRREIALPKVAQLIGALAPEPDRIMAPPVASKPFIVEGELVYDDRQGAFVMRPPGGRQVIVLLDIMRHGDNATQLPVLEETNRGMTLKARGYLSSREPATPSFDRRHCIYLYRAPR